MSAENISQKIKKWKKVEDVEKEKNDQKDDKW
jgi:hypothetical protein